MKANLEIIRENLCAIKDRFILEEEEETLVNKINDAKFASEVPLRIKDVNAIRVIKKRLTALPQDNDRLQKIKNRIQGLKIIKSKSKNKILF